MKIKKNLKEAIYIILGTFLMAISINFFLLPNKLSSRSDFHGIATVIYYFFNVSVGTTIFVLNIPLFILGFIKIGKEFILKTVITTFIYSIFLNLVTGKIQITEDKLLAAIYGGVIMGVGMSLIFKANSSSGRNRYFSSIIKKSKTPF